MEDSLRNGIMALYKFCIIIIIIIIIIINVKSPGTTLCFIKNENVYRGQKAV